MAITQTAQDFVHHAKKLTHKWTELGKFEFTRFAAKTRQKVLGGLGLAVFGSITLVWLTVALGFWLAQIWDWNVASWTVTGIFALATIGTYLVAFGNNDKKSKEPVLPALREVPMREIPLHALDQDEKDKAFLILQAEQAQHALARTSRRLKVEIQNTAREKLHPSSIARELIEKKPVPYLASALAIGFVVGYSHRRAA